MALNGTSIFTLLDTALGCSTARAKKTAYRKNKKRNKYRQRLRSATAAAQNLGTNPEVDIKPEVDINPEVNINPELYTKQELDTKLELNKELELLKQEDPAPTTSTLKRPASPETKPAVAKKKAKQPNRKVPCRISIVLVGYPHEKLTDDQYQFVTDLLLKRMDRISMQYPMPKFHQCYLAWGAAMVTCADDYSKNWVKKTVPDLQMPDGARLRVVDGVKLGAFTRVAVWIPGCVDSTKDLLRRLARQNVDFSTRRWKVYSREDEPGKGCRLVLGIDTCRTLQGWNFRPFLGLGRVTFKLLDPYPGRNMSGQ